MLERFRLRRYLLGALCALGAALVCPARATEKPPLTAIMITAKSGLPDDNFADSAVLVLNNIGPAPIGLITNRPTKFRVANLFPELQPQLAQVPARIYFGGPVELDVVWFLFRAAKAPEDSIKAFDDVYLSSNRELLVRLLRRKRPMEGLRIFVGHSGWGPGQLEAEIGQGDWVLSKADADTIFSRKADHPWPSASATEPET